MYLQAFRLRLEFFHLVESFLKRFLIERLLVTKFLLQILHFTLQRLDRLLIMRRRLRPCKLRRRWVLLLHRCRLHMWLQGWLHRKLLLLLLLEIKCSSLVDQLLLLLLLWGNTEWVELLLLLLCELLLLQLL